MKYIKTILMILGIIVAAALLYLILKPDTESAEKKEAVSDVREQYNAYSRQIRELKNQISQKEKELQGEEIGWVILAFSSEDPDLMGTIFSTVKEAGIPATVVVNPQKLPGRSESSLSLQEVQQLKQAGWDIALGGALEEHTADKEVFTEASAYLEKNGLGTPKAYFFNGGDYQKGKEEVFPVMESMGFRLAAAFGDSAAASLSSTELEEYPSIYVCQNVSMREGLETAKRMISLANRNEKPLVLSDYTRDNAWETKGEESIEEWDRILTVVKDMQRANRIKVGNVASYLEYYDNRNRDETERQQEYETFRKECQEKIAELEMKRRNLGTK